MAKGKVIHPEDWKEFVCDETYSSRMLLDDEMAGCPAININEGTLKAGCKTAGGVHEQNEIYYIAKGEGVVHLDDECYDVHAGTTIFIPAGVFHSVDNKSDTDDFVLITLWEKAEYNETYFARKAAWGKGYKRADED